MYCGKCGAPLADTDMVCPQCGVRILRPEPESAAEAPAQPIPPQPQQTAPEPQQEAFFDVPARQPDEEWLRKSSKMPGSKKAAIVLIVLAAAIVLGVGGFFGWQFIYHQSDGYKIEKAQELLLQGDIDGGLSEIKEMESEQANAMRDFAEILHKRDAFAARYQPTVLQPTDDPVKVSYDRLVQAFGAFHDDEKLPEKLQKYCDTAYQRTSEMEKVFLNVSLDHLTNAQLGVLRFGERKRGAKFTIKDIESAIAVTEPSITALQTGLIETEEYRHVVTNTEALAFQVMNELFESVSTQLSQDKIDLADYKKSMTSDDQMQYDVVASNYRARVSQSLAILHTKDDAAQNAETLYNALCYAWMAYAFNIS